MFKNKYLKQLQDVQAQIKKCKATIATLNPPTPTSWSMQKELRNWLYAIFNACHPSLNPMFVDSFSGFKGESIDYVNELGQYLINISSYYKEKEKREAELEQLRQEERNLKNKLGID